ncbi:virB8 family protein [Methylophaga sp.]|jgi:type IV secretion system protein VirB8|uniref:virB8 family protein n=1 Tax=Methylophaga sp. TaxID=2024840 RepID=UPI003A8DC080
MSEAKDKKATQEYLKQANFWELDKTSSLNRSNKVAWSLAVFGLGLAAVCAWSVGQLAPLKTVEPYVIRVNETSGSVDIVTALKNGKTTYEMALNKYFIAKYIRAREGYSRQLAEEFYYTVGLLSGKDEKKRYFNWFNPKNSDSPLNIYDESEKVMIDIQSISPIGDKDNNIALVRYIKKVEHGNTPPTKTHWAATVRYSYTTAPTNERDREINPLGFQVVEYRNDPDTVGQISTPTITYKADKESMTPASNGGIFPQTRTNTDE